MKPIKRFNLLKKDANFSRKRALISNVTSSSGLLYTSHDAISNQIPSNIYYKNNSLKLPNENITYITQKDIEYHGTNLAYPGKYQLSSDLLFEPYSNNTAAILITSSNVYLDLSYFTIINRNGKGDYGIIIARDVSNVTITGLNNEAQINDFNIAGIRVYGRTTNIKIENVSIIQHTPKRITDSILPDKCSDIINFRAAVGVSIGEGDTLGVHMLNTFKTNIVQGFKLLNTKIDGHMYGLHIIFTNDFVMDNCLFTKNTFYSTLIGSSWAVPGNNENGLEYPLGNGGVITNCRYISNHSDNIANSKPEGIFFFTVSISIGIYNYDNVKVTDCVISDTVATGYLLACDHDSASNVYWNNITITDITSTNDFSEGFHLSGSLAFIVGACLNLPYPIVSDYNATLENITVQNVTGYLHSAGITLAYVNGCVMRDCTVNGINSYGEDAGFYFVGDDPTPINGSLPFDENYGRTRFCRIKNCIAKNVGTFEKNLDLGIQKIAAGFYITYFCNDLTFENCIAAGNCKSITNTLGGGFFVHYVLYPFSDTGNSSIFNINFIECDANNNGTIFESFLNHAGMLVYDEFLISDPYKTLSSIVVTNCKFYNNIYGIYCRTLFNALSNVFLGNEIYSNFANGIFSDTTLNQNNVFVKNVAYSNQINYNGLVPGVISLQNANTLVDNYGILNADIN